MGRLIRISIYALIILILYFWVIAIIRSYQKDQQHTAIEQGAEPVVSDSLTVDTTTNAIIGNEALVTNEDIVDGKIDYDALDKKVKQLEEKKQTTTKSNVTKEKHDLDDDQKKQTVNQVKIKSENASNKTTVSVDLQGDGGGYKVMVGSYLLKENAQKMVEKLKGMGYRNAEIVVFKSSGYHSVVAARYDAENKAKAASAELKRKGVDSFVKK